MRVEDLDGCPRYIGRLFRDVEIGESPVWLKARLRAAGVRSISNVVDVTNYVMLALGSPLHVFDYETLHGGVVIVRRARPARSCGRSTGHLRKLDPADLMIADAERAVALAGIMGGEETEVAEKTTSVLLEAANFEPVGILSSSERHALRTEGSNRWEKGVDPHVAGPRRRSRRSSSSSSPARAGRATSTCRATLPERQSIRLRPERTDAVLGLEVAAGEQAQILKSLGFDSDGQSAFLVPTWRARDVTREIDLIEEVARFRLERHPVHAAAARRDVRAADALAAAAAPRGGRARRLRLLRGVHADVRPAEGDFRLPEPLSTEAAALRTRLRGSLVDAARQNVAVGNSEIALFEIARVYLRGDATGRLPDERWHVAGIVEGGFAEAKWAVEQLYARAEDRAGGTSARRSRSSTPASPRARTRAGSASCTPRCSTASGARSSSTSTRSSSARPRPRRSRR